jgi:hypothetical protein
MRGFVPSQACGQNGAPCIPEVPADEVRRDVKLLGVRTLRDELAISDAVPTDAGGQMNLADHTQFHRS